MQASQFLESADGETEILLETGRPVAPFNFDDSRDYVDNNSTPAVGGRRTTSNSSLRLMHSMILGQAGRPSENLTVNRLTYGVNWTLRGGRLLMFNIERRNLPQELPDMNVVGVCRAASF